MPLMLFYSNATIRGMHISFALFASHNLQNETIRNIHSTLQTKREIRNEIDIIRLQTKSISILRNQFHRQSFEYAQVCMMFLIGPD